MIDRGANPFIVTYDCTTRFESSSLGYLSRLPSEHSVYFITRPLPDEFKKQKKFLDAWFYKTGVFDGKFNSVIGQGAGGTVVSGNWFGKKAAFKFVEIDAQKFVEGATEALKTLNEKLSEMISVQSTVGLKIVSFYGHYR